MTAHPALLAMPDLPPAPRRRGFRAAPGGRYHRPAPQVFEAWLAVAGRQPRTRCLAVDRGGCRAVHVQRSQLLRFPDVVRAEVVDLGSGDCAITIDSRSRFALYDFGVNRRRIEHWLAELENELATTRARAPDAATG